MQYTVKNIILYIISLFWGLGIFTADNLICKIFQKPPLLICHLCQSCNKPAFERVWNLCHDIVCKFGNSRVLNTYVISKFYRILYLSQSRLIFLSNFEIYLLYGDVRC